MLNMEKIRQLYEGQEIKFPIIGGILYGNGMGEVYCNDESNPTHCFIVHKFGFCQEIFDKRDSFFFEEVIKKYIENKKRTKLRVYNPSMELYDYISKLQHAREAKRVHYCLRKGVNLEEESLLSCEIQMMNKFTFKDIFQLELAKRYYKDEQDFCENAIPFIAKYDNQIIGIIYSAGNDGLRCEIDIFVDDRYREKGVARKLAYKFLNECINRGIEVNWDCYENNVASNNLAISCGFEKVREYYFFNIE